MFPSRIGRRGFAGLLVAAVAALGLGSVAPAAAQGAGPTVFAAASLKTALDEIGVVWTAKTGKKAAVSYAAASALAKQIEQGAPADLFVSADVDWMDFLAAKGLIRPESRVNLLTNTLVLIAPAGSPAEPKIAKDFPLAATIGDGRLATGDVRSVPVGKYAKAALTTLGVWAAVEPRIAGAENVRAALSLVARGEARYGIVYGSDARSEPKVMVVDTFPAASHPPIVYPAAITKEATSPDAAAYLDFLKSPEAAKIFAAQGFAVAK